MEIILKTDIRFPTLNQWYAGNHWTVRNKQKKDVSKELKSMLAGVVFPPFDHIEVSYHFHFKRRDVDNTITAIKFLLDTLKEMGYIVDDTPEYVREVHLVFEKSMPVNTQFYKIKFIR